MEQRRFQQLAEQLRELIGRGEYPVGNLLPAERQLQERFGVSRTTVRRALAELVSMGWAESSPKRKKQAVDAANEDQLAELREKFPNSYFYENPPRPLKESVIEKFDEEDLHLLAFMPKRDDFEHVWIVHPSVAL